MYIDKWRDKCYNHRVNGCRFLQKKVLNASQTAKRREIFSMSDSSKWEVTKYQQARFIDALTSELAPLRAKVGISQGDLAALIGVSRQTYSAIECGKRKMSWNTYLSLFLFYDYNKDILIDPVFVRNSDYCMIVSKNDPEDTNLTYID